MELIFRNEPDGHHEYMFSIFSKCEIRSVPISQLSKHHARLLQRTDLCKLDLLIKDQTDGVIDEITLSGQ